MIAVAPKGDAIETMRLLGLFLLLYRAVGVRSARSEPIPLYMDEMLHAGRTVYDKQSPPIQEEDKPTKVELAMYIEGMSSFRTQTMDFQLDVYFQQFWRDPRLAHNESRRVLVRDKKLLDRMWHPDVYFANARIAEFHEVTQPNFLVWIEPNGKILYDTRVSMIVLCTLNLEKWPLDDQRCHLRILSYAYDTDQLQIEWAKENPITRNPNIAMSDMQIVSLYPGLCDGNYSTGTWSCVTAEFFVKREITHHVMQSYVPTTLIVVISWFSFWLDVEAVPARVSLAITTLLTLSTQANAARMALPEVSYMKAIDVWMGACMMFVFGVMIEFTIVNYAQRQGRKWHRSDALVMASSLESMTEKAAKMTKGDGSSNIGTRAREFLDRIKGIKEHQQLVEEEGERLRLKRFVVGDTNSQCSSEGEDLAAVSDNPCDSPKSASELWKGREADKAERLANWAVFDESTGQLSKRRSSSSVWSKLSPNGGPAMGTAVPVSNGAVPSITKSPTYGSTNERPAQKTKSADKWTSAIKQIQKHNKLPLRPSIAFNRFITHDRKLAGRNRAKRIDQKSRWVFPLSFIIFNISYWSYYLYFT